MDAKPRLCSCCLLAVLVIVAMAAIMAMAAVMAMAPVMAMPGIAVAPLNVIGKFSFLSLRLMYCGLFACHRLGPNIFPHTLLTLLQENSNMAVVAGPIKLPQPFVQTSETPEELALKSWDTISLNPNLDPRPSNVERDIL
mmetsp:Transcript_107992/g.305374  ORF Transcript_107992/g.305374 Transcript_107992/m.305374 type:complete len:140 (+) Transcript_107992:684-1103(+)